ncbi:MAG TPA: DUF3352 domain-containing protein [Ktedonobacterales bacterium]|nr:DUF3352 domain-containing protein [Ktedonobacterales bacterium]
MDGQQADRAAETVSCPNCGAPLRADATVCGTCGRAVTPVVAMEAPTVPAMAPLATAMARPGEPAPGDLETTWPAAPPASHGALAGMASLASTPVAPPVSRRPRSGLLAGVAAVCLLALLGGGAFFVYANFIRTPSQTESARYVPDNAVFYASVDLVAASNNSHHFNVNDTLSQANVARTLKQATGLDWKSDVQPWVGRMLSVAAFPTLTGGATAGSPVGGAPLSVAVILQSRDDGAATTAVDKALAAQSGSTYAHGSYSGFTQRTATGDAATFEIGSGLVIFASTQTGAHMVVDRVTGHGATLAGSSDFIRATSDLPSDRYGTFYVSVATIVDPLGTGGSGLRIPFLDTYPTIAGSVAWTNDGLRTVADLKPARKGVPSVPLNGDTTGLAALVPANAVAYVGAAKAGPLVGEFTKLITTNGQSPDPIQSALGVNSADPALAQPAAFFLVAAAGPEPQYGLLLRAPDQSAANALLATAAKKNNWTSKAITVNGTAATEYDSAAEFESQPRAVVVALFTQGTLVLADSTTTAQAVLATSSGGASLAHAASFQKLVADGPSSHAVTAYANTQALTKTLGIGSAPADAGSSTPVPGFSVSATLLTLEWTTDRLQLTDDSLYTS